MKKEKKYKQPPPRDFVHTELGSAVFADAGGRPKDREYLIIDKDGRDDLEDGADNDGKSRKHSTKNTK